MKIITTLLVSLSLSVALTGQDIYQQTRGLALAKNYEAALANCANELNQNPQNVDFINLKGWILGQQNNYEQALEVYASALTYSKNNYDALAGMARVHFWAQQNQQSLTYCNRALASFARDPDFLWLKIQNLMALEQATEALYFTEQLLLIDRKHTRAKNLRNTLAAKAMTNQITTGYSRESYQSYYNTVDIYAVDYLSRRNWGTIGFRVQMGNRADNRGVQYELESYPRLWKGSYAYINLALSNQRIFPDYRYAIDLNQTVFSNFAVGLGLRSLHFSEASVNILKFSSELYLKSFRLEGTLYGGAGDYGNNYTYLLNIRKYFNHSTDYAFISFGNAISPDFQGRADDSGDIYQLSSKQLIFGGQARLLKHLLLYFNWSLMNNELPFSLGDYVNGQTLSTGLIIRY